MSAPPATQMHLALDRHRDQLQALVIHALGLAHRGRANGVRGRDLASKVGVTERTLRLLISAAREQGAAICGTPASGYFIANSVAELEETARFHHARAMHELRMEAQLRRIPLPVLLGQLNLKT